MANVVVVGSQWGDEGKGKIVDWLSERADIVVRFQGGHNAGHTLVVDGTTYKLSLLPSGVVRKGKLSVIGNGVVIDPWALAEEIAKIEKLGVKISRDNLRIAENATLILPLHRELDALREAEAGDGRIGTTKRGIGPAYEDKVGRRAIRVMDLQDLPSLKPKIERILAHHNPLRRGLGQPEISADELCASSARSRRRSSPMSTRCGRCSTPSAARASASCSKARKARCSTSITAPIRSSPRRTRWRRRRRPARALGPGAINYVLGITKAYTTRVGEGPFPTELKDETGRLLGERGAEFGTVTGRPRRCGWFDACLVRQTRKVAGINGIALTKLDVLDQLPELKICVGYRLDGKELDHLPAAQGAQARVEPIYETMEGWTRIDARRAVLGRAAGAMHQICAAAGGADRRAGGAAVDQPEARGHHPRARSLRGLG